MHENPTYDPRANITRQIELARALLDIDDTTGLEDLIATEAFTLARLVLELDSWRSSGGYDPYMKDHRDQLAAKRAATTKRGKK